MSQDSADPCRFVQRLANLDRRWVFLAIAVAVTAPFAMKWVMPVGSVNARTQRVFDVLQKAQPGEAIMIAFDYGPAAMPELQPMAVALIRHALSRNLRVVAVALDIQGVLLAEGAFAQASTGIAGKEATRDYVNLGFKPGYELVILGMGSNIVKTYAQDAAGHPTAGLPVLRGLAKLSDLRLVIDLAQSDTPMAWILFGYERFHVPLAAGVTAVMATDFYPYLGTGQLTGLISGLKGAAEYETLLGKPDKGTLGMTSQSVAHVMVIFLVLLGNLGYMLARRRRQS